MSRFFSLRLIPRMIAARRPFASLTRAAAQAIGLKGVGLVVIVLA